MMSFKRKLPVFLNLLFFLTMIFFFPANQTTFQILNTAQANPARTRAATAQVATTTTTTQTDPETTFSQGDKLLCYNSDAKRCFECSDDGTCSYTTKACLSHIICPSSSNNNCSEAVAVAKADGKDFKNSCSSFSPRGLQCAAAIHACEMCPEAKDTEDTEDTKEYDCVMVHEKTKCVAKSGGDLEVAKEKRDKHEEKIDSLQDKIEDLEKDKVDKENELKENLTEVETSFTEIIQDLERNVEEAKYELGKSLKRNKETISKEASKQLAKIQGEIDNNLKVSHDFENIITKLAMDYRKERRQIFLDCEMQAQGRLAQYRQSRQRAIKTGRFKISLSSILKTGYKSFETKDKSQLKAYTYQCLKKRNRDFSEAKLTYNQQLKVVDQQKKEYLLALNKRRKELLQLSQKASNLQNQSLQEYSTEMNRVVKRYQKDHMAATNRYSKQKKSIQDQTKTLTVLESAINTRKKILEETRLSLLRERTLIQSLLSKGASSKVQEESVNEAGLNLDTYRDAIIYAQAVCGCSPDADTPNKKCQSLEDWLENTAVESNEEDESTNRRTRTFRNKGTNSGNK